MPIVVLNAVLELMAHAMHHAPHALAMPMPSLHYTRAREGANAQHGTTTTARVTRMARHGNEVQWPGVVLWGRQ